MTTSDEIDAALDRLFALSEQRGHIGNHELALVADDLGFSPGHVRRLLVARHGKRRGEAWQVEEWLLPLLYAHGNLTALHEDLLLTREEMQKAGAEIPAELAAIPTGYASFRRAFRELPDGIRKFSREGTNGLRKRHLYLRWEAEHRNAIWQADTCQLDIWILPQRSKTPIRPFLVVFLDDRHRVVTGAGLFLAAPTAEEVAAVCVRAMRLKAWSDGSGFYGGRPSRILVDNGPEYRGEPFVRLEVAVGLVITPVLRHTPTLKGKVERFFGTLQRWVLVSLPGYTKNPKSWSGRSMFRGDVNDLLDEYELWAHLTERIEYYNLHRRHRALGTTPAASWNADQVALEEISDQQVREALLRDKQLRVAGHDGVRFRNHLYIPHEPTYDDWIGARVAIGYLPHEDSFIEIFTADGRWISTATLTGPDSDGKPITGRRFAQYDYVREQADIARELRVERRRQIDAQTGAMPRLVPTLLSRRTGAVSARQPRRGASDPTEEFLDASTRPTPPATDAGTAIVDGQGSDGVT